LLPDTENNNNENKDINVFDFCNNSANLMKKSSIVSATKVSNNDSNYESKNYDLKYDEVKIQGPSDIVYNGNQGNNIGDRVKIYSKKQTTDVFSPNSSSNDDSYNHSSMVEANRLPNPLSISNKLNKNKDIEKEINLNLLKKHKYVMSNLSNNEKVKEIPAESDLTANPEFRLSANDVDYMDNVELSEHFEKKRNLINQTFLDKVEKIIAFLEENKIEFTNDYGENPLTMLRRLKDVQDINERNVMIDKIEAIVAELLKGDDVEPNNDKNEDNEN
jgi:hypothetical protein